MVPTHFTLNNGLHIPSIGFGTWQSPPGEVEKAVEHALKSGYRLIDCAFCYGNEAEVGRGLKKAFDSGIKREDVTIQGKLWCTWHAKVEEALDKSLSDLGLDYLDVYLVHWPVAYNPNGSHPNFPMLPDNSARDVDWAHTHIKTWKSMEKLLATGKVKAIGVCNYSAKYLEQLLPNSTIVPAINQIENHPLLPQQEVVDLCREKGILIEAYSPFGSTGSPVMKDERVKKVAQRNGVSEGTVLLSWHVSQNRLPLAKSVTPSRIEANLHLIDLSPDDQAEISSLVKNSGGASSVKRYVYPPHGVDFGFPDKAGIGKDAVEEARRRGVEVEVGGA